VPTKIYVNLPVKDLSMLITEPFFRSFTTQELAHASKTVFHTDPVAVPAG
jgi:predicted lactoylglutathione lyase